MKAPVYKLHASGEDYLEAVLVLQQKQGVVRSVDIARHMDVTKPSVCRAVAILQDGGFLTMATDNLLHLTNEGLSIAKNIYERHCFFKERLILAGVDPFIADKEACKMEHTISEESFRKLKSAVSTK